MKRAIHCLVSGHVQGVFFRASASERAQELGVSGWARNLPDGRVEVLAAGEDDAVDAFRGWLDQGPPAARVERVEESEADPGDAPAGFETR
ncbi:MAG: acylphosphatase [Halofilum sp. (in: g-proteobacteria)]